MSLPGPRFYVRHALGWFVEIVDTHSPGAPQLVCATIARRKCHAANLDGDPLYRLRFAESEMTPKET